MISEGFQRDSSTQGGSGYPCLPVSLQLLPQAGKGSPWRPCWGITGRTGSSSQQPLGTLLRQPHRPQCSAQGIPGTNSIEMHPLHGLVERGHEVLKLSQGKWPRTFAGTQCYKDGTSLKTSDQPERAEREKQRKAQTLPCL